MDKKFNDIDSYIASFPAETRLALDQLRQVIRENAPDAEETIAYGIPTFRLGGNLVHFAAYKNHVGFYPAPSAITRFSAALASYHSARGSVQFPLKAPLPLDLVADIVKFRVEEQQRVPKK